MDSKRTTPETNRTVARLAGAGSMVGLLWLMLSASGCPMRDKEIRITDTGVAWVFKSCDSPLTGGGNGNPGGGGNGGPGGSGPGGNNPPWSPPGSGGWSGAGGYGATAGSGGSGGAGGAGGVSGGGGVSGAGGTSMGGYQACQLDKGSAAYPTPIKLADQQTDARLFLISPGDNPRVEAASKCMRLHPCYDGGRSGKETCLASDLNQQLDGAMPAGLGFDGLKNPDDAQLVLAFYQPTDSAEENGGCHRADMVACAGLAAPLGGGAYDVSCASCQYGVKTTVGSDTGPCPRPEAGNGCFLWYCNDVLAASGYD